MKRLYTSIADLPLKIFISCIVDKDLKQLIISGDFDDAELMQAWAELLQEYADVLGTAQHKLYTALNRSLTELQTNYTTVVTFIPILERIYVKKFCKEINAALHTSFRFDPKQQILYYKELEKAMKMCKGLKLKIDHKIAEIDAMTAGSNSDETVSVTRNHFLTILIRLSDHAKFRIGDDISTFEYCKRIHDYNEYNKQCQQKKK